MRVKSASQPGGKTPCKKLLRKQKNKAKISNKPESTELKQDTNQYLNREQRNTARSKKKESKQTTNDTESHTITHNQNKKKRKYVKMIIGREIKNNKTNANHTHTRGRGKNGPRKPTISTNNKNNNNNIINSNSNSNSNDIQRDAKGRFAKIKRGSHGGKVAPKSGSKSAPAKSNQQKPADHDLRTVDYEAMAQTNKSIKPGALNARQNNMNELAFTRASVDRDCRKLLKLIDTSM